jgi:catechol 2,3-dioxygenase-like lactoylglutathione lyase family enzyme
MLLTISMSEALRMHRRITRLNHIALMAKPGGHDLARAFYVDILEMQEVVLPPELLKDFDLMWFRFLDMMIHLSFTNDFVASPVGRHICLEVEDVFALRSKLETSGHIVEDQVLLPDRNRFFIPDPFGNYFELMEFKNN